jgi:hypothetical protein
MPTKKEIKTIHLHKETCDGNTQLWMLWMPVTKTFVRGSNAYGEFAKAVPLAKMFDNLLASGTESEDYKSLCKLIPEFAKLHKEFMSIVNKPKFKKGHKMMKLAQNNAGRWVNPRPIEIVNPSSNISKACGVDKFDKPKHVHLVEYKFLETGKSDRRQEEDMIAENGFFEIGRAKQTPSVEKAIRKLKKDANLSEELIGATICYNGFAYQVGV